ncbi:MAG: NAD(P)/FAD-dependent oxidoreductase [Patescibacteria group bacterium]
MNETYDLAIVGMGFAGYTGGIYAARYGLKTVIIGDVFGGQTAEAHIIGNYPGFEEITGMELMQRVQAQTLKLGVTEIYERVNHVKVHGNDNGFELELANGKTVTTKKVLLTIGMNRRKLNVPGESEFYGKGVTYCATCDGYFFKGKDVAVIGGGDSAVTAALYLADICNSVQLIVRSDRLKAEQYWVNKLEQNKKITVRFNSGIEKFTGGETLETIHTTNPETPEIHVSGAFIEIGHAPNKTFTEAIGISTDEHGFIIVDKNQQTSQKGIFAAGDSTNASNKFAQLLTAASEAAIAVEAITKGE